MRTAAMDDYFFNEIKSHPGGRYAKACSARIFAKPRSFATIRDGYTYPVRSRKGFAD